MPSTPTYGLPFEAPGDLPGHTLDGGPVGDQPILAEAVEAELSRIDDDVVDLQGQITAINSQGWHDITPPAGIEISSNTTFLIDSGDFDIVRLYLRGALASLTGGGNGEIGIRVNNDSTADMHWRQMITWNCSDGSVNDAIANDGSVWRLAQWSDSASSNVAYATIYRTHLNSFLGFEGGGHRASPSASGRRRSLSSGSLSQTRLLTSINVRNVFTGAEIDHCHVWIEGHRRQ